MIWCIKTYIIAYVKTQKKIRFIIHYVKPTEQLLFKIRFSKCGPKCRRQVVKKYVEFYDYRRDDQLCAYWRSEVDKRHVPCIHRIVKYHTCNQMQCLSLSIDCKNYEHGSPCVLSNCCLVPAVLQMSVKVIHTFHISSHWKLGSNRGLQYAHYPYAFLYI